MAGLSDRKQAAVRSPEAPGSGAGAVPRIAMAGGSQPARPLYIPVRWKLLLVLLAATLWFGASLYWAQPWIHDLRTAVGTPLALMVVAGVALIPGYANAFLLAGLLFDRRPSLAPVRPLPPLTVLIAAYNEEACIAPTIQWLLRQAYEGPLEILVVDDGSTDRTCVIVRELIAADTPMNVTLRLVEQPCNGGKARALNAGLAIASHELIVTVDADTLIYAGALERLVTNQLRGPPHTAATAGTVLVRNSRDNLITRLQEWDYFLGIAVVKRIQSLLQGTLVAQGAFSIYRKTLLQEVGGWPETVGEDIVLTWALLARGYRVGYAENAFVFTDVPETYGAYYRQRKRWARGLIEAFKQHPRLLRSLRLNTPFLWFNLTFPYLDFIYLTAFLPGVIAAVFFQNYAIVGLMTLLLIPLATVGNLLMYFKQRAIFRQHGLRVRRNVVGVVLFTLVYQLVLAPASLMGYVAEFANQRKSW